MLLKIFLAGVGFAAIQNVNSAPPKIVEFATGVRALPKAKTNA